MTDAVATLRDSGSRNGTLVNGVLISSEQQLYHGDRLQFGPLVFEVRFDESSGTVEVDPEFQAFPRQTGTSELPAMKD